MSLINLKRTIAFLILLLLAVFSSTIFAQQKYEPKISLAEQISKELGDESRLNDKTILPKNPNPISLDELSSDFYFRLSDKINFEENANTFKSKITENFETHNLFDKKLNGNSDLQNLLTDSETKTSVSNLFEKSNLDSNSFNKDYFTLDKPAKNNADTKKSGIQWSSAVKQSLMFLSLQHGYAFTQPKTREALKGNFFKDYIKSVKSLRGWGDGGRFFTNYIAHPMQGSLTGFILIQNDPIGKIQPFGSSKSYWKSRIMAFAWSAAWSTQFEIGPISQASIGNVGLSGKQTYVDLVMTPVGGIAMMVAEDAIDRFVMQSIERRTDNFYVIIFSRMLLNPTRTLANVFRFKPPWFRDRPRAK